MGKTVEDSRIHQPMITLLTRFRKPMMALATAVVLLCIASCATTSPVTGNKQDSVYLFTSFRNKDQKFLRFLYSEDGYHWTNVPGTFLEANVGATKQMRDPSLVRGPDGTFHLVWTTGWADPKGFGYASSKDLIHWSEQQFIPAMTNEPTTVNSWAPELFYDATQKQYIIVRASTIPGRFPDYMEAHTNNHRLYFTTTRDFKKFAPTKLFLDPGFSVIDAFIAKDGGHYVLICKDNSRPNLSLRVAFGKSPLGPWENMSGPVTHKFTEGSCALKIGDDWIIYFDPYRENHYGAARTRDFKTFTDITTEMLFPEGHKHGTALKVPREILDGLLKSQAALSQTNL
jgi:hypothetical protein